MKNIERCVKDIFVGRSFLNRMAGLMKSFVHKTNTCLEITILSQRDIEQRRKLSVFIRCCRGKHISSRQTEFALFSGEAIWVECNKSYTSERKRT